ncbi:MAG TPA: DUF2304 domain-containing protein [Polyangia bacterium]|nr:DUF2304 domain-containing protein [Polyangia bacterium]
MIDEELLPVELQLISGAVLLIFLARVVWLVRRDALGLRESFLWLSSTLVAFVFVVFPTILRRLATTAGVRVPSNALFALALVYVLVNLLSVTIAVSRGAARTRRLSQECALLRGELDELRRSAAMTVRPS